MEGMISDTSEGSEISRIKDRIASLVDQRFTAGSDIYYLSLLGNDLGSDRQLLEKLSGLKLSEFIQKECKYAIGRTGQHANVLYIVRPQTSDLAIPNPKPVFPRYISRFWAAFAIPLQEGERRLINISTLDFGSDETELRKLGPDIREIDAEYIAPHDASGSAAEIGRRVERWLQHQQLDPTPFIAQPRRPSRDASPSLLDQLLEALRDDQLMRVSLSLDIVRTLRERRGR